MSSVDLISLSLSIHNCNAPKVGLALEHKNTRNAGIKSRCLPLQVGTAAIANGNPLRDLHVRRSFIARD